MPRYVVHCSSGFAGVEETYIVDAYSEEDAEKVAQMEWEETCDPHVSSVTEATEEDEDAGYMEI